MLFIFPCHRVEINRNRCRFHAFSIIIKPDVPTLAIAIIFFLVVLQPKLLCQGPSQSYRWEGTPTGIL